MDPNVKLNYEDGDLLADVSQYRRLVGKLNSLIATRPDISFAMSVVNQFLQAPRTPHWHAMIRILRYLKCAPGKGLLYKDNNHTNIHGYTGADWVGLPLD